MAVNKNNRRVLAKPAGAYTEAAQTARFVPLHAGMTYMRDPRNGMTHHVKVNSERFNELLAEFIGVVGKDRIAAELDTLSRRYPADGWAIALRHVRDAA
jgi:hypothetical protein